MTHNRTSGGRVVAPPEACLCGALLMTLAAMSDAAAAEPAKVPPSVVSAYEAARDAWESGDFDGALSGLDGFTGEPHAHLLLLRGRVLFDKGEFASAVGAYERCLKLDGTRRDAGLGMVHALVALERYADALMHCGRWIDPANAESGELRLYAIAATRAGDKALALRLAERALIRFPNDDAVRRILLSVLIDVEDYRNAALHLADLLSRTPGDRQLWQYLAALRQEGSEANGSAGRVALEAALLGNPADAALRTALIRSQLSARHVHAALANVKKLMAAPSPSASTVVLAVHCALEADQAEQARAWLDTVPAADRTRDLHRLAVRLALAEGDHNAARHDIGLLLEAGDEDDRLLIRAGALDEELGRAASAEALYRSCMQAKGPSADTARLYLARVLLSLKRYDEAAEQVQGYLAVHPADRHAGQMLEVITASQRATAALGASR